MTWSSSPRSVRAEHLAEARAIAPVVCVQNPFSLEVRRSGELLRYYGEQGIAFVPFYAIAREGRDEGARAGGGESAHVRAVAEAHGASPAQVRLAWTLQQGRHALAIPDTGNPVHMEEKVAAGALHLTGEDMDLLQATQD